MTPSDPSEPIVKPSHVAPSSGESVWSTWEPRERQFDLDVGLLISAESRWSWSSWVPCAPGSGWFGDPHPMLAEFNVGRFR